MKQVAAWVGVGWLGFTIASALGARIAPAHLGPDLAVVVVAFVALRRHAWVMGLVAAALGYLVGRQALAPVGLHEFTMLVTGLGVYLASGQLAGTGARFFAFVCCGAVMGYHALTFVLLYLVRDTVGFPTWATALLLPSGLLTAFVGLLMFGWMERLDARLSEEKREGLAWR